MRARAETLRWGSVRGSGRAPTRFTPAVPRALGLNTREDRLTSLTDQQRGTRAPNVQRHRLRSNLSRDTWLSRGIRHRCRSIGRSGELHRCAGGAERAWRLSLRLRRCAYSVAEVDQLGVGLSETRLPRADRARNRQTFVSRLLAPRGSWTSTMALAPTKLTRRCKRNVSRRAVATA
jgi:hypothetical protein